MEMTHDKNGGGGPVLPRRAFVAAGLSALVAAGILTLGILGQVSAPKTESFRFSRSTTFAAGEESRLRGFLTRALSDDRMVVVIVGHTGDAGDEEANLALSTQRAEVAARIAAELGLSTEQLTITGVGGASPLPKQDAESDRAHQSRLSRVDVFVQLRR